MSSPVTHSEPPPIATTTSTSFPPPQPSDSLNAAQTGWEATLPDAARVRLGVMRRIHLAVNGMDGHRRWRLSFTTIVGAAQVIAFVVILSISYRKPCDQRLGLYLILLVVRIALSFPTALWTAITPRPTRQDTPERRDELERERLVGNRRIDHRVKKLSDLISFFGIIVFVLGNVWVVSSDTCETTNPILYKGALAALILSWCWILEYFILCALAIFFLPILLFGMRRWGWGEKKHEIKPLKKGDIDKLPQRIFVGTLPPDVTDKSNSSSETATLETDSKSNTSPSATPSIPSSTEKSHSTPTSKPPRSRQWWRLWRSKSASNSSSPKSASSTPIADFPPFPSRTQPIKLPESQNACSICLSEYEVPPLKSSPEAASWEPEILLLLPCAHAFHSSCLVDWLAVSGRCPLCQAAVFPPKPTKAKKVSTTPPPLAPPTSPSTAPPPSTSTTPIAHRQVTNDRSTQTTGAGENGMGSAENETGDIAIGSEERNRPEDIV